ncbi:hypothetical protein pb186bvf_006676 [Paramecium bursaria]
MHKSNASTDNNRSKRDLVSENKSRALISQGEDRKLESQQSKFRMSVPQSRKTLRDQEEIQEKKVIGEGRTDEYGEEEEEVVCLRFPHLTFCPFNYQAQVKDTLFQEILDNIYVCGFAVGLTTKFLLIKGITNILNVTSMEYTKRTKYFKYLNIDIHNTSDEDIKKHFRISNRFIRETIQAKGKVLIHCRDGLNIGPYSIEDRNGSYIISNTQFRYCKPFLEIIRII